MFPYVLVLATFGCLFGAVLLLCLELAREIWRDPDWFFREPETRDADRAATRSASAS